MELRPGGGRGCLRRGPTRAPRGRRRARPSVFFNDTATTEIYTLSLHDALPISGVFDLARRARPPAACSQRRLRPKRGDRKSTRLNSSHANISYAVSSLKKKKTPLSNLPKEKPNTPSHIPATYHDKL